MFANSNHYFVKPIEPNTSGLIRTDVDKSVMEGKVVYSPNSLRRGTIIVYSNDEDKKKVYKDMVVVHSCDVLAILKDKK